MTSRKLINDWVFSRLDGMEGYTGRVARVVPALLEGMQYPLITYQFQNFKDVEYGNGRRYISEAEVLVKVWDRNAGFDAVDAALDALPGALLSQAGTIYEGHRIEYVERMSMADDFEAVDGDYYCVGLYYFKVGIKCLEG